MTSRPLPTLDGLRAASILLVLAAHAGFEHRIPGGLGVTIFFFVSGFLITTQLRAEHEATGRISLGRFFLRRALRLLPASLVFIAVSGLAFVTLGGHIAPAAWLGATFYVSNVLQIFTTAFETDLPGTPHPFSILWSLAIEEQFYLAWPVVLIALMRAPGRRMLGALGVALLAVLFWRIALHDTCSPHTHALLCGPHADDRIYKSTDTRFDSLLWGAFAALLPASAGGRMPRALASRPARAAALAALAVAIVCRDPFFRDTLRYTLIGAALFVLVPPLTCGPPMRRTLDSPAAIALGRLSYGLYLWHWCALMLVDHLRLHRPAFLCVYLGLTAIFALASWHAIERPMLRLRHRAGSRAPHGLIPAATPDTRAHHAPGILLAS